MPVHVETLLVLSTFLLGLRHGVDWDHIAAISDITLSQEQPRESVGLGTIYALGHAFVVGILGTLAVFLDVVLPDWVDAFMEPLVGVTLIVLGLYLIYALWTSREHFRPRSRWMLLWEWAERGYHGLRGTPLPARDRRTYNVLSAWVVGMIHGIGAETPSQILLFIAAAGVTGHAQGLLIVFTFLLGLLVSNTVIVLIATYGLGQARQHVTAWMLLGGVTSVFSIAVGMIFLTGQGHVLPTIFGT